MGYEALSNHSTAQTSNTNSSEFSFRASYYTDILLFLPYCKTIKTKSEKTRLKFSGTTLSTLQTNKTKSLPLVLGIGFEDEGFKEIKLLFKENNPYFASLKGYL